MIHDSSLRTMRYYDIMQDTKLTKERYPVLCQSVPQSKSKRSSIKELNFDAIQSLLIGQTKATTDLTMVTSGVALRHFILRYGKMLMGQFLMDATSTTKTVIRQITRWITSSASQQKSTLNITPRISHKNAVSGQESIWTRYVRRLRHGIVHKRVEPFTLSSVVWPTKRQNTKRTPVTIAEKNSNHVIYNLSTLASAPMLANQHGGVTQGLITKHAPVNNAVNLSHAISILSKHTAHLYAGQERDFQTLLLSPEPAVFAASLLMLDVAASKNIVAEPAQVTAAFSKDFISFLLAIGKASPMAFYMVARFDLKPRAVTISTKRIY